MHYVGEGTHPKNQTRALLQVGEEWKAILQVGEEWKAIF
tara:strand:+ start:728 stop:844 length:117 start_codon:yes stop_codon:yes gene_type:complete